jgi:hypothetical protein
MALRLAVGHEANALEAFARRCGVGMGHHDSKVGDAARLTQSPLKVSGRLARLPTAIWQDAMTSGVCEWTSAMRTSIVDEGEARAGDEQQAGRRCASRSSFCLHFCRLDSVGCHSVGPKRVRGVLRPHTALVRCTTWRSLCVRLRPLLV